MHRRILPLGLAVLLVSIGSMAHAQDSLERGLLRQAPMLIKRFQEKNYKNVGVLKFLAAHEGDAKANDKIGTLNMLAARRLEVALILENDPRNPVGIISNASEVAQKIKGASHLDKKTREEFFKSQYPLAWGNQTVQPDAFVTGFTVISKDLRTLKVSLLSFDRVGNKLEPLGEDFQVANAGDRLSEMGESFVLRGAFDDGNPEVVQAKKQEKVFQQAVHVREEQAKHPVQEPDCPVTLDVLYDGNKIPLEFKNGKAHIAEPREGQTVEFGLSRDQTKNRYGVVLKVNGENTLDKQRLPDVSCRKWILDPGTGPWRIGGFQIGNNIREKFRVASVAESQQRAINYGHDVGTITLTVFREQTTKIKPKLVEDREQYENIVKKLTQLPDRPMNHGALLAQLLDDANRDISRSGGLIVEGTREKSEVRIVGFVTDPTPVMCVTIVYYRK